MCVWSNVKVRATYEFLTLTSSISLHVCVGSGRSSAIIQKLNGDLAIYENSYL